MRDNCELARRRMGLGQALRRPAPRDWSQVREGVAVALTLAGFLALAVLA